MAATTAAVAVDDAATSRGTPHPPGDWPHGQARFLNRAALICSPDEACGLILGEASAQGLRIHRLTHCENHSGDPTQEFRIPAEHLMSCDQEARAEGLQVIGAWHSHPDGSGAPSQADRTGLPDGWIGLIVVPGQVGLPGLHTYGKAGPAPPFVHA